MRLLLDECVDARLAVALRSLGHDVALVQVLSPSAADSAVLALALAEARILITSDLDFGELLVRTGLRNHGVVLLRLEGVAPEQAAARIDDALRPYGAGLSGHLLVIEQRRARLRQLAPPPALP